MKVYLANGLFSLAEYRFNSYLAKEIREKFPNIDLYVPQEAEINDKNGYADSIDIFEADTEKLVKSDLMIAVIDGAEIDSGTACEIGIASALDIPMLALYSDIRQHGRDNKLKVDALIEDGTENQFMYRNLFVVGAIKYDGKIVSNVEDLLDSVGKYIKTGQLN